MPLALTRLLLAIVLLPSVWSVAQAPLAQPAPAGEPAAPAPAGPFSEKPRLAPIGPDAASDRDAGIPEEKVCNRAPDPKRPGILTVTGGVDFTMYMSQISAITRVNWVPLMPKVVEKPFYATGEVVVCFAVLPDGRIEPKSMMLQGRSGNEALDRAAWGAIQTSVYPRLPHEFQGPRVVLQIHFEYNKGRRPDPANNLPKPPGLPGPLAVTLGYGSKL